MTPLPWPRDCVCGGTAAKPNPDCERCAILTALAKALDRVEALEDVAGNAAVLLVAIDYAKAHAAAGPGSREALIFQQAKSTLHACLKHVSPPPGPRGLHTKPPAGAAGAIETP